MFEHEKEAFAAEASMINAFNYVGDAGLQTLLPCISRQSGLYVKR